MESGDASIQARLFDRALPILLAILPEGFAPPVPHGVPRDASCEHRRKSPFEPVLLSLPLLSLPLLSLPLLSLPLLSLPPLSLPPLSLPLPSLPPLLFSISSPRDATKSLGASNRSRVSRGTTTGNSATFAAMSNVVVVGMQWGDEGKGKVVDLLCPKFEAVARYQGGNNAGHTVKFGDQHFSLHLIPSGILHADMQCYLGNGMVVNPDAFFEETSNLEARGVEVEGRLWVSDRAQVLLPMHPEIDLAREAAAGNAKIGTTSRGIGPAYEHKVSRFGIRVADLDSEALMGRFEMLVPRVRAELEGLGVDPDALATPINATALTDYCREVAVRLAPYKTDVSLALNDLIGVGGSVLFEGAQGALLDIDHGSYPYVTSSNSSSGGAAIGTGVPPTAMDGVLGVLKAYGTRVGEGPFPAELDGTVLEYLRDRGREFGTTTGRPRRCGWLDTVVARYARRINGIRAIALTKLDVLDDLEEIKVCVGYNIDGERVDELPADLAKLGRVQPIYETFPGWQENTIGRLRFDDLPVNAQQYVRFIEEEVGAEISLVSTGPKREETIMMDDSLLESWTGGLVG